MRQSNCLSWTPFFSGRVFNTASALALSILMSVSLIFFLQHSKEYVVLAAAVFFFGMSIMALAGGIVKRLIYSIFLIQIAASYFLQFSFFVTVFCMIFAPPVILLSRNLGKIDAIPYHKPLALMLSGWLISLVYSVVYSYNDYGYTFVFDIYLLLGFCIAYLVYFMLKLEYLNVDRLMRYIMFSGLFFIGMVLVKYVINGYALQILNGRFGMLVDVNSNLLSLYIGMTLPCVFFPALFEIRNTAKKKILYAISLIYLYIMVITGSRGGFLGIAILIAYLLWYKRSIKWVLGALAGFVVIYFTVGLKYMTRLFAPSTTEIMSDLGRLELLKVAFKILRDNYFFFGIGMNNYSRLKMDYGFPVWFSSQSPYPVESLSSHNIYTEMWMGWGILGLLGWLIFNGCIVYALLRNKEERYNSTAKAIAFAMSSFLLYGLVDSNIGNFSVMFTYFSLLGTGLFIIAQTNYTSNKSTDIQTDFDQPNS